jgi:hypothetical protein
LHRLGEQFLTAPLVQTVLPGVVNVHLADVVYGVVSCVVRNRVLAPVFDEQCTRVLNKVMLIRVTESASLPEVVSAGGVAAHVSVSFLITCDKVNGLVSHHDIVVFAPWVACH